MQPTKRLITLPLKGLFNKLHYNGLKVAYYTSYMETRLGELFIYFQQSETMYRRFSCVLIPFSMLSLDSHQGKVKNSLLYGRGSSVTILVGRHFQSEKLPIAIFNQKCCQSKDRPKKT